MPIKVLPEDVASQIAAGEVVERPASVVKELVENSLDAGATKITIIIEEAGKKLIEVADDGIGIPSDELALALSRHATSKLSQASELFSINTLGFRGEALASIASVSRFTITSRVDTEDMGGRLEVDGGEAGRVEPIGAAQGTVVRVEDLFLNVPARLKFLKKDITERRQIDAFVSRYAVANPGVHFQLTQESRISFVTSGNGDRREALGSMYSPEIARQMLAVEAEDENVKIRGFVSPTSLTRSNRSGITFFVNGRWVQDGSLSAAVVQAYHSMLMVGRFPIAILFLEINPEMVDVNVHPAKSEVRFSDRNIIFTSVQRAVRRALLAYSPVPAITPDIRWMPLQPNSTPSFEPGDSRQREISSDVDSSHDEGRNFGEAAEGGLLEAPSQRALPRGDIPLLRLVGQVGTAFLVAEGPDGLYLIDQHAAHERVLFERFMNQRSGDIPSQVLLEPVIIELPPESSRLLDEQLPIMKKLGYEIDPFGPGTYKIRSIPGLLLGSDPAAAVRVVIEDFEEDETPLQDEIEAKVIARVCKRAAVKAGQTLSPEEQKALLKDLEECEAPRTCPHGRPTMIHISIDLLERQFGRKGAR